MISTRKEIRETEGAAIRRMEGRDNGVKIEREDEHWVNRNEFAISRFYDENTRTYQHLNHMSRAYQSSVKEGIARIIGEMEKKGPKVGAIAMVDAGVGTAYFLEKFLRAATSKGLDVDCTALDLSKEACLTAGEVCSKEFGNRVKIVNCNIANMTDPPKDGKEGKQVITPGTKSLVFLNYVLQYAPINDVLIQTNKALEVGGKVLITNFKPGISMSWDIFWTNLRASWDWGKKKEDGHGRLREIVRYFLLFFKRHKKIIKFASEIDRNVKDKIFSENPDDKKLTTLLEVFGFKVLSVAETHYGAAHQFIAEKVKNME